MPPDSFFLPEQRAHATCAQRLTPAAALIAHVAASIFAALLMRAMRTLLACEHAAAAYGAMRACVLECSIRRSL